MFCYVNLVFLKRPSTSIGWVGGESFINEPKKLISYTLYVPLITHFTFHFRHDVTGCDQEFVCKR